LGLAVGNGRLNLILSLVSQFAGLVLSLINQITGLFFNLFSQIR
jgi:hypothetical protein